MLQKKLFPKYITEATNNRNHHQQDEKTANGSPSKTTITDTKPVKHYEKGLGKI